jgi:hypothetical protein
MCDRELILLAIHANTELLNVALDKIEKISVRLANLEKQVAYIPRYSTVKRLRLRDGFGLQPIKDTWSQYDKK